MKEGRQDGRTVGLDEARRRAAILRRYVSIGLPTAEDDRLLAAALGLSEDTALRLAAAWRLHHDTALLAGPAFAASRADAPDRAALMAVDIDMNGVEPDRQAETLRRIRIIQAHLLARERGQTDAATSAAAVGVSRPRFIKLVEAWRAHASAAAMPGARRGRRTWRRNEEPRRRRTEILLSLLRADPAAPLRVIYARHVDAMDVTKKLQAFLDRGVVPLFLIGDEHSPKFFQLNEKFAVRLGRPLKLQPLDIGKTSDRRKFRDFCLEYDRLITSAGITSMPTCLTQPDVLTALITAAGGHIGRASRIIGIALPAAMERGAVTLEAYDLSNAVRDFARELGWVGADPFSMTSAATASDEPCHAA